MIGKEFVDTNVGGGRSSLCDAMGLTSGLKPSCSLLWLEAQERFFHDRHRHEQYLANRSTRHYTLASFQ